MYSGFGGFALVKDIFSKPKHAKYLFRNFRFFLHNDVLLCNFLPE